MNDENPFNKFFDHLENSNEVSYTMFRLFDKYKDEENRSLILDAYSSALRKTVKIEAEKAKEGWMD